MTAAGQKGEPGPIGPPGPSGGPGGPGLTGGRGPKGTNMAYLSRVFKNIHLKLMLDMKYFFIIKLTMKKTDVGEDMIDD